MHALVPQQLQYKKWHKGKISQTSKVTAQQIYKVGHLVLQSEEPGRVSAGQLEVLKQTARKALKRLGRGEVFTSPQRQVSEKPLEVRMGKGKGSPGYWATSAKAGSKLFTLSGVAFSAGLKALMASRKKIPVRVLIRSSSRIAPADAILSRI